MKKASSFLSLLLTGCMLLSFVPAGFAEEITEPVSVSTDSENLSVSKTVDGDVTVTDGSIAVASHAGDGGTASLEVTGNVSIQGSESNPAVYADANGEDAKAEISIGGNVDASVSTDETNVDLRAVTDYITASSATTQIDIKGSVTAAGETGNASDYCYVDAVNPGGPGSSVMNVEGYASATANGAGQATAKAVEVGSIVPNGSSVTVTVGDDVTAHATSSSGDATAEGLTSFCEAEGSAKITADGNVTAVAQTLGDGDVLASGIAATNSEHVAKGSVTATAAAIGGDAVAQGVNNGSYYDGSSSITVNRDIVAESSSQSGKADTSGICAAGSANGADVSVRADGYVSAEANGGAGALSTGAHVGDVDVTVNSTVTSMAVSSNGDSRAMGVFSYPTARTNLSFGGKVSANAEAVEGTADAYGVVISFENNAAVAAAFSDDVSASAWSASGSAESKGLIIQSEDGVGAVSVAVEGTVSSEAEGDSAYAEGIEAYNSDMTVNGDITAHAKGNKGLSVSGITNAAGQGHGCEVNVTGSVQAVGEGGSADNIGSVFGVTSTSGNLAESNLAVGGDVTAAGDFTDAIGIWVQADSGDRSLPGSTANVSVDGTVTAESRESSAFGVVSFAHAYNGKSAAIARAKGISVSAGNNGFALGTMVVGVTNSEAAVQIGEDGITATGGKEAVGAILAAADSSADLEVKGDVTADDYGIVISDYYYYQSPENKSPRFGYSFGETSMSADVLVEGSVKGGVSSFQVDTDQLVDDVKLTVWKAELNQDNRVVSGSEDVTGSSDAAEKLEANILYIIKLEQPDADKGSVTLAGVVDSHGFSAAKEGETVTLKTMLKEGYRAVAAFNGVESKTALMQDAAGDFYLVVPKGGGVFLSVQLEKVAEEPETKPEQTTPETPASEPTPEQTTPEMPAEYWTYVPAGPVAPKARIRVPAGTVPSLQGYNVDLMKSPVTGRYYYTLPQGSVELLPAESDSENEGRMTVETKASPELNGLRIGFGQDVSSNILSNAFLNAGERQQFADGKDVRIFLELTPANVSEAEINTVQNKIGSGEIASWFTVSAYRQLEGTQKTAIEKAQGKVALQISAPDDLAAKAAAGTVFEVIGIDHGTVVRMPAVYHAESNTFVFETDFFGLFALTCSAVSL